MPSPEPEQPPQPAYVTHNANGNGNGSNGYASYPHAAPPHAGAPSSSHQHQHPHPHAQHQPPPLNMAAANAFHAQPNPYMLNSPPMFSPFSPSPFSPTLLSPGRSAGIPPGPPSGGAAAGRTVYVGNLPAEASVDELLNQVKFGPIESVKVLPEKSCAFISFLDGQTAASFHADASVKKLTLHAKELKIGWGRPSPVPPSIIMAVQQNQATRNVYVQLGHDDATTEEDLRDDLSRFGPIDQVKIVRDKNIGFVHFLSIQTAMHVVSQLPQEPQWANRRVNFGKDRCAYVPKSQQQNQAHNNHAAAMGMAAAASLGYPTAFGFAPPTPGLPANVPASAPARVTGFGDASGSRHGGGGGGGMADDLGAASSSATYLDRSLSQLGNRTVYLGNIHPSATIEEICNHIRGGILQTVRYLPEKHIAFVTFIDANSALAFHHLSSEMGILLHHRRLKIGWGKHSGPLSPAIAMAVQAGCSRNVYIGNIEDPAFLNEEKLRADFTRHGEVELVNSLRDKNCAFVNFCSIQNAIKAIEAMKGHPDYGNVKISHGKDRCGRVIQVGGGGGGGGGGVSRGGHHQQQQQQQYAPPHSATFPLSDGANGHSLSREPSAHDMPPIPVTIAEGNEEEGIGGGSANGGGESGSASPTQQRHVSAGSGGGGSRPVRRTVVVRNSSAGSSAPAADGEAAAATAATP